MKFVSWISCMILMTSLTITSVGLSSAAAGTKGTLNGLGQDKKTDLNAQANAESAYAKLPLTFEANQGQTDASVKFLARGKGYTLFLTSLEAVLALQTPSASDVVRMKLKGANTNPIVQGLDILPGQSNYLTGNDNKKWHTNVERYSKVKYKQVYPGIDIVYYGNEGQLEYDFVVAPGANPGLIRMDFQGAKNLKLDKQGNLIMNLKEGQLTFNAPMLYQKTGDTRIPVEGRFVLSGSKQVCFKVGDYDKSKELVIDPILMYSTYLGGNAVVEDRVNAIALDAAGNIYLTGLTVSAVGFPNPDSTAPNYDPSNNGGTDVFVIKITTAGAVEWATYLGGTGIDIANGIAVDGLKKVYITGSTTANFPMAGVSYQNPGAGGTDAFVTAISSDGSALIYSTYLGAPGEDFGYGIAVNAAGYAYVTGQASASFPRTPGALAFAPGAGAGGASDIFVAMFDPLGNLSYSTYFGGSTADYGKAIAIDGSGNAYITGYTAGELFPIAGKFSNVFKTEVGGPSDAFVARMNPTGTGLDYITYVGGQLDDAGFGIALDGTIPTTLNVYITGETYAATSFPNDKTTFATVGQTTKGAGLTSDAFVFKINMNNAGALAGIYATYLGGSNIDYGTSIKVDAAGHAYVTGHTQSPDFPVVNFIPSIVTAGSVFVTEINVAPAVGETPVFSTNLGGTTDQWGMGLELDSSANIYVGGYTNSTDFPGASAVTMPAIIQPAFAGGLSDGFFTKISAPSPVADPLPTITVVLPAGGTTAGGTSVVITGTAFTGATSVKFGAFNATSYSVDSNTQITAVSPVQAAGVVNIAVQNAVGSTINMPEDDYTYFVAASSMPVATITGLNPVRGLTDGGTEVIITGSDFSGVTGANGVKFGELNAASYVVNSDTKITATTKAHAAGVVDVLLTNLVGTSTGVPEGSYMYYVTTTTLPAPTVTGLAPKLGPSTGGTIVVIVGTGFSHGVIGPNGVKFGELIADSYAVNSDTKITAITKAHDVGIVDVIVTSLVGVSLPVSEDQYTYFLTPIIPNTGDVADFDPYIFPSPTTGSTAGIAYFMHDSGLVDIRIYNEIGGLVKSLTNERKPAGTQGSSINVSKLAPGVYFCLVSINYDDGTKERKHKIKFVVIH